jgi:hypothetical protein
MIDTDMTQYGVYAGGAGNKRARDDADGLPAAKRSVGSMVGLSGGQHMSYVEQNKSVKCVIPLHWSFFSRSLTCRSFLLPAAANPSRGRRSDPSSSRSETSKRSRTARTRLLPQHQAHATEVLCSRRGWCHLRCLVGWVVNLCVLPRLYCNPVTMSLGPDSPCIRGREGGTTSMRLRSG